MKESDALLELYPLRKETFPKGGCLLELFLFAIEETLEVVAHIMGRGRMEGKVEGILARRTV